MRIAGEYPSSTLVVPIPMAEIIKRNKALAVNPLKVSQPVGASLAFLGINRAVPMPHGSQGCTAFGKPRSVWACRCCAPGSRNTT